jgi:hypothetical protein
LSSGRVYEGCGCADALAVQLRGDGAIACVAGLGGGLGVHGCRGGAGDLEQRLAGVDWLAFFDEDRSDAARNGGVQRVRLRWLDDEVSVFAVAPDRQEDQCGKCDADGDLERKVAALCPEVFLPQLFEHTA